MSTDGADSGLRDDSECRSAALISREGSIDWLCGGGSTAVRSLALCLSMRVFGELLLQTDTGTIMLTDLMPVASGQDKQTLLLPQHELLRLVGLRDFLIAKMSKRMTRRGKRPRTKQDDFQ